MQKSRYAKKHNDYSSAKEQVDITILGSMETDGTISKDRFKKGILDIGGTVTGDDFPLNVTLNGFKFTVDSHGNATKMLPTLVAYLTNVKVVNSSGTEVEANSTDPSTAPLFINFEVSLAEGQVTSVTYKGANVTAINGIYSQEVSANGNYDFTINGSIDGEIVSDTKFITVDKFALRQGIEVGHYITYEPTEKNAYTEHLTSEFTGSSGDQSIRQQYKIWRVLNKNPDGSLDIIPSFRDSGVTYTNIRFRGARGCNNAVTILDEICEYLYANETKGITARSIDYEDVTSHMKEGSNDTEGLRKIAKYQKDAVANFTLDSTSTIAKDTTNNTITYIKEKSWYPNIYEHQEGVGINIFSNDNGIITYNPQINQKGDQGVIGESDKIDLSTSDLKTQANNLTLKYSYYCGTISESDFIDSNARSVICGAIYDEFWLASRCVILMSRNANFSIRYMSGSYLYAEQIFFSTGSANGSVRGRCVCPVVTINPNVQVTKCTGTNSQTNRHTVVIPNN